MMLFFKFQTIYLTAIYFFLIIMISVHMHDIVSEFNRVIFELRSAHLYPESELLLLVTCQMAFINKDL